MFVRYQYIFFCIVLSSLSAIAQMQSENSIANVVRKSMVATAKSCMNHVNATQDDLEQLRNEPPYPEKSSCIIMCLLEKIGVVKNNRYSKTGFMMAVSPLILAKHKKVEHMKAVSENCDKEVNHLNISPRLLGNEIITCIYKYAPELHMKS